MTTTDRQAEDFIPHRAPVNLPEIKAALADLNLTETSLGLSIALPYTRREDGTVDTIEIGAYNPTGDWMVYTGRDYRGRGWANVTATVAQCPGHMVILVVRALHSHLMTVGPQGRPDTVEGDILYALGLARGEEAAQMTETAQPDPQVVAWMRDRMSEAPYGMTAKEVRAYREANGLSAEDMTAAYCVAARKPLTVAASLFIGRAPDGCPVLTFKDEDGDLIALEHGNPTTPSGRALWQHLAATLPPVTEDEEPQP